MAIGLDDISVVSLTRANVGGGVIIVLCDVVLKGGVPWEAMMSGIMLHDIRLGAIIVGVAGWTGTSLMLVWGPEIHADDCTYGNIIYHLLSSKTTTCGVGVYG